MTQANTAIRSFLGYLATVPRRSSDWTPAEIAVYDHLRAQYVAAVRARDEARAREGDEEPEPVAA